MKSKNKFNADLEVLSKQDLVEIYEKFNPQLFKYSIRMLEDPETAEDCVSETFSRFLKAVQAGIMPDNLKAYLFRIAHNWIMDYYRQNPPLNDRVELSQQKSNNPGPESTLSAKADHQRVRQALLELTEEQRQVIILRYYEDWSHGETASALGRSVGATRALQHRALKVLKGLLIPDKV